MNDLQKYGGLPPNVLASERHIEALKKASKRECSYADSMEVHGYSIDIVPVELAENVTRWNQVIRDKTTSEVIYSTSFFHDRRVIHLSECPLLKKGCSANPDANTIKYRCQFRWIDIVSCPEGPAYTPRIETKD
jgi:hypothetical protein